MIRLSLFWMLSLAAAANAAKVEETLATVNNEAIYLSDYETNAKNILDDLKRSSPQELTSQQTQELRKKVLEQMVDDLVLLQEAKRLNVRVYEKDIKAGVDEIKSRFSRDDSGRPLSKEDADKAFQSELKRQRLDNDAFEERIRRQLMVIKLVDQNVKSKISPPGEKDSREFFKKVQGVMTASSKGVSITSATAKVKELEGMSAEDKEEVMKLAQLLKDRTAERVRARHVLIKVPPNGSMADKSKAFNEIKKVQQDVKGGLDFAEAARQKSEDTESARKGGDLGYFIRGWMVPAFEKAAFAAAVGEVIGPIETEFGYHLIMVEEKRAATPLHYEDVEEDLNAYLMQRNFQKNLRDYVGNLRSKAEVKIKDNLLDSSEAPKEKKKEGNP